MNHTELQSRIISTLDSSQVPLLMPVLARAIGADEDSTSKALRSLRKARRVHQVGTGSGAWRLTNGERCALTEEAKRAARIRAKKRRDDLPDPTGAPPKAPRDGLPEPAIGDLQTTLETTQVTGMSDESCDLQPDQASAEWDCTIADGLDLDEQTPEATTATDQIAADRSPAPELATDGDTTDCSDKLTAERSGPQPAPGDTEVSAAGCGIVNLAIMPQCVPERCDRCRCWTREPGTVFGWCIHNSRIMQPEHGTCGRFQSIEPTDAELDAIEAEVDPDGEAILDSVPEGLREAWNADSEDPYEQKGREQVEDAPRRTYICDTCKHREPYQVGWCSELKRVAKAPECALYEVVEAEESTDQDTCFVCEIFATCTEPDRAADSPVLYADGQPRCAWFKRRSALEADDFEEISGECPDLAVLRAEHAAGAWEENPEAEAAAAGLRALDELCAAAASVQPAACPECGVNEECTPKPDVTAGDEEPTCGDCEHFGSGARDVVGEANYVAGNHKCLGRRHWVTWASRKVSSIDRNGPCIHFNPTRAPTTDPDSGDLPAPVDLRLAESEYSAPLDPTPPSEHVWGVARDRPTSGLRIEAVAKELVELDDSKKKLEVRRQELLEELRGLVG